MKTRKCKHCGKEFTPKSNNAKFCCPLCGVKENAKTKPVKTCVICGAEFHPVNGSQKTCGNEECKRTYGNTMGKKRYAYKHNKYEGIEVTPSKKKKKRLTAKEWAKLTPSQRWEYMTLTEISAELARLHLSYGQAQVLKERRELPFDFGEKIK